MPPAKDDVSRATRARRDPRAEPDSVPPAAVTEEVVAGARRDPRVDPLSIPAMPAVHLPVSAEEGAPPRSGTAGSPGSRVGANPRFAELEPLFARNAWRSPSAWAPSTRQESCRPPWG